VQTHRGCDPSLSSRTVKGARRGWFARLVNAFSSDLERELADLVRDLCERHRVPGVAVGVHLEGRDVVVCHGVTSVDDPLPITDDTLFFIGSTTKTVTATALMALAESGRLSLEDRVVDRLPGLPLSDTETLEQLTVGHLMDHTAGWVGDVVTDHEGPDALAAAVGEVAAGARQLTPPGTVMSYNNAAFIMAGRLLEQVTAESYETAVARLVLEPLGMDSTWSDARQVAQRRLAVGHVAAADGALISLPDWPLDRGILPAGGLISSVRDQLRYARFHLHGGPVLSDDGRLRMRRRRVKVRSTITGVGISWLLNRFGSTELVEHGGNVSNLHLSSFSLAPELGIAVTTLSNAAGGRELGPTVVDHVLRSLGATPSPAPAGRPLPPTWREDYPGRYDAGLWSFVVSTDDKGRLTLEQRLHEDAPAVSPEVRATFDVPPSPLVLVDDDVVAPAGSPGKATGDFVRDTDGNVQFLRYGLRLCRKLPQQQMA
jgi:CubicO group peptidase (beta-lactamase class C family)